MPLWSSGNPYYFVTKMREMFESEEVRLNLNKWVDLVFGRKSRGVEARDHFNLFPSMTYPENQNFEPDDPNLPSHRLQVFNFG
jgi:hypothetical protein